MRFVNTADVALDFVIDGERYQVPVAGTCEIPDPVSYVPAAHRLPLRQVAAVQAAATMPPASPESDPISPAYTAEELRSLDDSRFQVPRNASRKTLHELCDRFSLQRPPAEMPVKELARSLALKLDEVRQLRDARKAEVGREGS